FNHENKTFTTYTIDAGGGNSNSVRAIYEDSGKTLWIGTFAGLYRMRENEITPALAIEGLKDIRINSIFEDSQNNIWTGTRDRGIFRYRDGTFSNISKKGWLSNDRVYSIMEDRDGSIWFGTLLGGLNRLSPSREGKFKVLGAPEGLSSDTAWAICESSGGYLWIGTYNGLNRLRNGELIRITTDNGLSSNLIFAISEDGSGFIWVGTEKGLNQLENFPSGIAVKKIYPELSTVYAVLKDRSGNLWVGTDRALLKKGKDGTDFRKLLEGHVTNIYEDRESNVWVSTYGEGLIRWRNGKFTKYTEQNGLTGNFVNSFYMDSDSILWVATTNGLSRFKDSRFTNYTKQEGLFSNSLCHILEDDRGNFWISSYEGIARVRKLDLNRYAEGRIDSIHSTVYRKDDGMKSIYCSAGVQTCGWKTADGNLWFPTRKGVVMIDPNNIETNQAPPPVFIQQVLLDGEPAEFNQTVNIKPRIKELKVHYTAVNLLNSEKVTFKTMLEGYEDKWVDAGTRREANYTNLDAGAYRFRVTASNSNGLWNEKEASIDLDVIPSWKTRWFIFIGLIALAVVALLVIHFSRKYMRLAIFWKNRTYVGNFKLVEKIGTGGMGTVFKAETLNGKKEIVAIKLLKEEFFENENVRERFKREAAMIDRLDHPNIVKVIERGESRNTMFIAMEFLDGETMAQKLEKEGRLNIVEELGIMDQIADAVREIHSKNIVHRDLKPGNIMLIEKDENPDFVKLLDFGLAKPQYQTRLTQTGIVIGTIDYMAPEQISGSGYSSAVDIYSMGVVFREMLTGE
ncbi:MAG: protein kinase, partial [bacterium]|nr:protein kinase [bacterium]